MYVSLFFIDSILVYVCCTLLRTCTRFLCNFVCIQPSIHAHTHITYKAKVDVNKTTLCKEEKVFSSDEEKKV